MPINQKKMKALEEEYGKLKWKSIYYALENKNKTSTKKK